MDSTALIDYLVEFYDEAEIRDMWKQVGDAAFGRVQLPIQINQRTRDGSSSGGILVSTLAEATAMMSTCKLALDRLTGPTAIDARQLATTVNFSFSPVQA